MQTGLEEAETPTPKSTPPSAPGRGGRGRTQQLRRGDSPDPSLLAFYALGERQRVRRECSPDPPRAKSLLSRRGREEAKMHLSPPGPESGAGRRRPGRAGGVCVCVWVLAWPLQARARAFPPEFLSGSSDSRGKLNILGQGEASCQVPTLHGVLPPPPPPSPLPPPPPTPRPSPPPPAAQIPAQSRRPRRCGCCCCCRSPRTRPLQPPIGPMSAGGESGFSTRNATRQPGELGARRRDRLIPAPRSSRPGKRGGDEGGRRRRRWGGGRGCEGEAGEGVGGRRLFPRRRCRYLSPPPSSPSSKSCREPQPKQAAASGSARRPRRRLTREEKKTRDGASALRSPAAAAAAGRLPPGSLHSRPSPPRARPSPPPGRAAEAPAPGLGTALGQRPYAAGRLGSEPASSRHPGRPPARRNPRRGSGRGCLGVSPKARGESGKTGEGANPGRRRSEGGGRRGGTAATGLCVGGPGEEGTRELGWILPNR